MPGGHLPHGTGEYYEPPGYYALAGGVIWLGRHAGLTLTGSERIVDALNAALLVGTILLAAQLAARLWPGRSWMGVAAGAFMTLVPIVVENDAMFHPEVLCLFLSTLCLLLAVRALEQRRFWLPLAVVLGLDQLVFSAAVWIAACVAVAFLVARELRLLLAVVVVAALIPAAWYAHQSMTYGGLPFFAGRPPTPQAHTSAGAVKPLYDRQPSRSTSRPVYRAS